ncbi:glycoside hydrolase family 75 protein [Streptomyces sp. NPDC059783]|uniref:glycoside hydrolase family 75 protein n=1 Tax=Streptomyces sp. NPDC059783 TaxID=3346944 RepID=UPI00365066FF
MRTFALTTVSGAALLAAGSLTPTAHGRALPRPEAPAPVRRAGPGAFALTPTAYARPVSAPRRATRSAPARAAVRPAPVAAAELLARTASCHRISHGLYRTDAGAPPTVPVCGAKGAVHWKADLDIDCDGRTTAACNTRTDPAFQDDTAFHTSDGRPLDARELPYVVVPGRSARWDPARDGIRGGGVVALVHEDRVAYAVVGDTGPSGLIGEASLAAAGELGIDPDPKSGGAPGGVTYILFRDSAVDPIESRDAARSAGDALAREFLRNN